VPVETWIAFALTAAAVIALPGPTVMMIAGLALSAGERAAMFGVIGVLAGDVTTITLSFTGIGAVLTASPGLFLALTWAGAGYLIWLGVRMWRQPPAIALPEERSAPGGGPAKTLCIDGPSATPKHPLVVRGWMVTVLNPKGMLFVAALMPQFIHAGSPALPQMLLLGVTHILLATVILGLYVRLSGRLRRLFSAPATIRFAGRTGAVVLVAAGLLAAWSRHR